MSKSVWTIDNHPLLSGPISISQIKQEVWPLSEVFNPSCVCLVAQSCLTLCNHMDCSPPGSYLWGFSRQEYWRGQPFPSLGVLPNPEIEPRSPTLQAVSLLCEPPGKPSTLAVHWNLSWSFEIIQGLHRKSTTLQ